MSSFKDFERCYTVDMPVFGGHIIRVKSADTKEFRDKLLEIDRSKMKGESETRAIYFSLVAGWSFDIELTESSFNEFLDVTGDAADAILVDIANAAGNKYNFFKKKSLNSQTGSSESGI